MSGWDLVRRDYAGRAADFARCYPEALTRRNGTHRQLAGWDASPSYLDSPGH